MAKKNSFIKRTETSPTEILMREILPSHYFNTIPSFYSHNTGFLSPILQRRKLSPQEMK